MSGLRVPTVLAIISSASAAAAQQAPPPLAPGIEQLKIQASGMEFDALTAGPANGTPVILLHGFPQSARAFETQLQALAEAGFRAVAPDQRGYSPGARPVDRGDYIMSNFTSDVLAIADALGYADFNLVGHDWGGAVAWVTATVAPERVRSLTVLSTPHYRALSEGRAKPSSDQAGRSSYFSEFGAPDAADRFLANDGELLRDVLSGIPSERRAIYVERMSDPATLRAALAWYQVFSGNSGNTTSGRGAAVTRISVPTLYIWGNRDQSFGPEAAAATRDFVAGPYRFVALDNDHWLPENEAARVNQLLLEHLAEFGGN